MLKITPKFMDIRSKKKGFTLIEILVVLGIISGLIILSVSSYSVARKKVQLDIATSDVESFIVEARDRARTGFFESDSDPGQASSLCFGVKIIKGQPIELLQTTYNRLALDVKCVPQDIKIIKRGEESEEIIIKEINQFDLGATNELTIFFRPPHAAIEVRDLSSARDPKIEIVIGFADSEEDVDHRLVRFDALTGNTVIDRYNP